MEDVTPKPMHPLKTALRAAGMRQRQLAIEADIPDACISEVIHGYQCFSPNSARRVIQVMRKHGQLVRIEYLLFFPGDWEL